MSVSERIDFADTLATISLFYGNISNFTRNFC